MRMLAGLVALLLALTSPALAAGLTEEKLTLEASFPDARRSETIGLDALVIRPDDGRRHPLAILSHGAPRNADDRPGMSPRTLRAQAQEFARRGWVAVAFMRRGYGESEGEYVESSGKCASPDYVRSGKVSAQDIRAAITAMADKPYVDSSRILAVGRSAGGLATIALTADPPPGLVAAINFAGGRGSTKPDEVCVPSALVDAFGVFGKTSRVPTLWVYAENDHFFNPALAGRFHRAFTEAGGKAEFIAAGEFGSDGHNLFSEKGTPIWSNYVDAFLARHKLTLVDQLLPRRDPGKPVAIPGGLGARGREAFAKYLDAQPHKAFATSPKGAFGWRTGQKSTDDAVEGAMGFCEEHSDAPCAVVMIDDDPVEQSRSGRRRR